MGRGGSGAICALLITLAITGAWAELYDGSDVVVLTPENFESEVGKGWWIVKVYTKGCEKCQEVKEEWKRTATALQGVVGVGAVNADDHKELAKKIRARVDDAEGPTVVFTRTLPVLGKIVPVSKYTGANYTASDLVEWALNVTKDLALRRIGILPPGTKPAPGADEASDFYDGTDVVVLTDDNFEEKVVEGKENWLVEFYTPWCGFCVRLKPTYIELATALKGKANIGAVNCNKQSAVCQKYGINAYPTIRKFFADNAKPEQYEGDRSVEDLSKFITGEAGTGAKAEEEKKAEEPKEEEFYVGTDVVILTADDFESKVIDSQDPWLVEFYAPWCGFCVRLKPTYIELATALKGKASIGAVDCTKHNSVCQKYGVNAYPTLKKFGADKAKPEQYDGDRSLEDLSKFVTGEAGAGAKEEFYVGTDVVVLTADDFEDKVTNSKDTWLVEFYAPWCGFCKRLKPTFIELATAVKGKASIGAVDCTKHNSVCQKYGVNAYPTLKKFGADKAKPEQYDGDRSLEDLSKFVTGEAGTGAKAEEPKEEKKAEEPKEEKAEEPKEEEFYVGTNVVILTANDFQSKVINSKDTWLVEFYAPWCGFCKRLKPTFIELATAVKGKASIGAVDCTKHSSTCSKFGVSGYPTLMKFGADKTQPKEYEGDRSLEDLTTFVTGVAGDVGNESKEEPKEDEFYAGTDVTPLTAPEFESVLKSKSTWLVEFYAPWCGHCKSLKPTYIKLAAAVKGKANIGAVDCTKSREICMKYAPKGYPTLLKFGADKSKTEEYEGDRTLADLITFVTGKKAPEEKKKPEEEEFYAGTDVVVLTADDFEDKVINSKDTWLVEFYAPWCGFCKRLKPTYIELATAVKGKASIGAVDCTKHNSVCSKFGIKGYPTLKKFGADKAKPDDYNGDRSLGDLSTFVTGETAPEDKAPEKKAEEPKEEEFYVGTDVVVLTADDFEDKVTNSKDTWLVEFYAPWCGFCKRLKPTYIELATAVKGKASIGAVDCTKHNSVCNKFGIKGYPTLKKFGTDKAKPEDYNGDRSLGDLTTFVTGEDAKKDEL